MADWRKTKARRSCRAGSTTVTSPGSWEARYEPLMIQGDRAVATGESRDADGRTFSSLYVLRFDADGRCAEFVEWFMEQPGN